ncbi:MAG: hypothetical protein IPO39_13920 [Bacteroidetes bacterium]|nr:hypothetical protein [Bacteroidota bacterium]
MKFKLGLFVIIISILVLGCANQHAPKCSDAEIQSAALNIFNEKYKDNARNLYLTASYLSENKMPHGIMGFADSIVELSMENKVGQILQFIMMKKCSKMNIMQKN